MKKRIMHDNLLIAAAELRAIADAMDVPDWAQRELLRVARTLDHLTERDCDGPETEVHAAGRVARD